MTHGSFKLSFDKGIVAALTAFALAGCSATLPMRPEPPASAASCPAALQLDAERLAAIGPVFDALASDGKLAGGAVLVAQHGEVLYRHCPSSEHLAQLAA